MTQTELNVMNTKTKLKNQLKIGELSEWIDIQYHTAAATPLNDVDCAIAEVDANARILSEVSRIGMGGQNRGLGPNYRVNRNGDLVGSPRVYKAGRTTGWTEGNVVAINVVSDVGYSAGTARFRNQIAIQPTSDNTGPFSNSGDSGSGIFNDEHKLVALLYAGSSTRTLANPVRTVINQLETKLGAGKLTIV